MTLRTALVERLESDGSLAALVDERIFWRVRPQGSELPALVLWIVSPDVDDDLLDDDEVEILTCRLQADCLSSSALEAEELAALVKAALKDADEVDGVIFWNADVSGPRDLGDFDPQGKFIHQASVDVILRHSAGS